MKKTRQTTENKQTLGLSRKNEINEKTRQNAENKQTSKKVRRDKL